MEMKAKVLLAEDDVFNQFFALKMLENMGYIAEVANNGKMATEKAQQQQYDIILMDVQMPEMDGFEATSIIRQNSRKQPIIIAMTANALHKDNERCIAAGMDDYISKPVDLDKFSIVMNKWMTIINNSKTLSEHV